MRLSNQVIEFYGNRGNWFDFFVSIIIILLSWLVMGNLLFMQKIILTFSDSTISFLGIIIGFLLTTFSLLFLYNPEASRELSVLRKHKEYKRMLKSFNSTAFVLIMLIAFLIIFSSFSINNIPSYIICLFLIIYSFLKILRCLFFLSMIVELS